MQQVRKIIGTIAVALAFTAQSAPPAAHPVAVELFTSQGCSSCPPADALMARLATQTDVIAITRPVTYWDRLGWKDTLARPQNTDLQRAYADRRIPGAGVYTPQMVVQGRAGVVGGQEARIRGLIVAASRLPEPAIAIARGTDGGGTVTLSGSAAADTRVTLLGLKRDTSVAIGSGENGGRRVRYTNHVVTERDLGAWRGGTQRFAARPPRPGIDRQAIIVRSGVAGPILAARYL